ncbi:hypothetical protein AURDEDRAFT_131877, partial [Auricularia subglabra TFB-10046 SS5]
MARATSANMKKLAAQIAKEGSPVILLDEGVVGQFLGDSEDEEEEPAGGSASASNLQGPQAPEEQQGDGEDSQDESEDDSDPKKLHILVSKIVEPVSNTKDADAEMSGNPPAPPSRGASPAGPPAGEEIVSESDEEERAARRKSKGKGRATSADEREWQEEQEDVARPPGHVDPPEPPRPRASDFIWDDDELPDMESLLGSDREDGEFNDPEPLPRPQTWPFPRRQELVDGFRRVMQAFQDVGTERKATGQAAEGPRAGRPSRRRANAMGMLEQFSQLLAYHAAGVLGQRVETVQKFQSEAFQPRVQSRWAMFVSFLKNDTDYQPRRDLDELLGRKKQYPREETKRLWKAFQKSRTEDEIDFVLFSHLLAFPYGPEGGTPADRAELVHEKTAHMRKYSNYLAAVHNIDTAILMGGSRPDHDWHPAFATLIQSYHARDVFFNKFGLTEAEAVGAFQAEVLTHLPYSNSVHNLRTDNRLIAQGKAVPVRTPSDGNDSFAYGPRPIAYATGVLGRAPTAVPGPNRTFAGAGSSLQQDATARVVTGARVSKKKPKKKKKAADADADAAGDESDIDVAMQTAADVKANGSVIVPKGHMLISSLEHGRRSKVIHILLPLEMKPRIELDYQVHFTRAEKAYAVKMWRQLCADAHLPLRAASSPGLPLGDTYNALLEYDMTLVGAPHTAFLYGEAITKKTFDGFGYRMQRDYIFAILARQLYIVRHLRFDQTATDALCKMTGLSSADFRAVVITSPVRKVTSPSGNYTTPDCFVGSCRMMVANKADDDLPRHIVGMPRQLLHYQAMPFSPHTPTDDPANAARAEAVEYAKTIKLPNPDEADGASAAKSKKKGRKAATGSRRAATTKPKKKKAATKRKRTSKKAAVEEEEEEEEEAEFSNAGASDGEGASAPPVSRRRTRRSAASAARDATPEAKAPTPEPDVGDTDDEERLAPVKTVGSRKRKTTAEVTTSPSRYRRSRRRNVVESEAEDAPRPSGSGKKLPNRGKKQPVNGDDADAESDADADPFNRRALAESRAKAQGLLPTKEQIRKELLVLDRRKAASAPQPEPEDEETRAARLQQEKERREKVQALRDAYVDVSDEEHQDLGPGKSSG